MKKNVKSTEQHTFIVSTPPSYKPVVQFLASSSHVDACVNRRI